jgi:Calx-beta domain
MWRELGGSMNSLKGNRAINRAQRRQAMRTTVQRQASTAARLSLGGLTVFAGIGVCGLSPTPAAAVVAEFQVTSLAEDGPGSLRDALEQANLGGDPATITFDSSVTGTIELTSQLYVRSSVDIQGPGRSALTISGMSNYRVLYVGDVDGLATVSISNLTIANGYAGGGYGGGIQSTESLYLDNVDVINSRADNLGGGIMVFGNDPGTVVDIRDSTISGNIGNFGGGIYLAGVSGSVTIVDTTITDNGARYGGGGIYISRTTGPLVMTRANVTYNNANNGRGGGIALPTLQGPGTITDSHIDDNYSASYGGGLSIVDVVSPLTISGTSVSRNGSNHVGGGIRIDSFGYPVTLDDVDVIDNRSLRNGGGISVDLVEGQFTIDRSHIEGNESLIASGGGIAIERAQDDVDITNSFVLDNTARYDGGGILVEVVRADVSVTGTHIDRNTARRDGGGLFARNVGPYAGSGYGEQPYLNITGSHLVDNAATRNGAGVSLITVNSPVTIATTEISGNDAGGYGGGIDGRALGSTFASAPSGLAHGAGDIYLTVTDSLISGNSSVLDGGGVNLDAVYGPVDIDNSDIVTNTSGRDGGGVAARTVGATSAPVYADLLRASGDDALVITDSTISTNTSQRNGGGIEVGRIFGGVQLAGTELSDNVAAVAGGGFHHTGFTSPFGGGGFGDTMMAPGGGTLSFGNSTISTNRAATGGGAFLTNLDDADFTMVNSTVTANTGTSRSGGIAIGGAAAAPPPPVFVPGPVRAGGTYGTIVHSTIAGNVSPTGATELTVDDTFVTVGHSIIDGTISGGPARLGGIVIDNTLLSNAIASTYADGGSNLLDVDPQLEPLANTGGRTKTMRPLNSSPVLNAGESTLLGAPTFDQRGTARIIGVVDLGAVEVDSGFIEFDADSTTMSAAEGSGTSTLTVVRSGGTEGALTVDVSTVDGSAAAPNDFTALSQSLTWADGDATSKTVDVQVNLDGDHEDDEMLQAKITSVNQSVVGARDLSSMTVTNRNTAPTISDIADQRFSATTASAPIPFTVGDAEQSAPVLALRVTSNNQTVLPNSGITIAGSGLNRTIALDPALNAAGVATVTVTVSDGRLSSIETFTVTVESLPVTPIDPGPVEPPATTPPSTTPPTTPPATTPPATTPPAAPTVNGAPGGGISTTDPTPTIAGTGQPGATIAIVNGSGETLCTAVVDATGSWSCTLGNLTTGRYGVTVFQTFNDIPSPTIPLIINVGTDGGGRLPTTGSDAFGLVWLAAGLAGVGSVLTGSARRKARASR